MLWRKSCFLLTLILTNSELFHLRSRTSTNIARLFVYYFACVWSCPMNSAEILQTHISATSWRNCWKTDIYPDYFPALSFDFLKGMFFKVLLVLLAWCCGLDTWCPNAFSASDDELFRGIVNIDDLLMHVLLQLEGTWKKNQASLLSLLLLVVFLVQSLFRPFHLMTGTSSF